MSCVDSCVKWIGAPDHASEVHMNNADYFMKTFPCDAHFMNTIHKRWHYALVIQSKPNAFRNTSGCEPFPQGRKNTFKRPVFHFPCPIYYNHTKVRRFRNHRQSDRGIRHNKKKTNLGADHPHLVNLYAPLPTVRNKTTLLSRLMEKPYIRKTRKWSNAN